MKNKQILLLANLLTVFGREMMALLYSVGRKISGKFKLKMNWCIFSFLYLLALIPGSSGFNSTEDPFQNCSTVTEVRTTENHTTILQTIYTMTERGINTTALEQTTHMSTLKSEAKTTANQTIDSNYQNTTSYKLSNVTSDINNTETGTPENITNDENSTLPFDVVTSFDRSTDSGENHTVPEFMDQTSGGQETITLTSPVTSRYDVKTADVASDTKVHLYISPTAEDFLGALIGLGVIQLLAVLALLGVVTYFFLWKRDNKKQVADVERQIPNMKTSDMDVSHPQTSTTTDKPEQIDTKENVLKLPPIAIEPIQRDIVVSVHRENNPTIIPETNARLPGVSVENEVVRNETETYEKRRKKRRKRQKEMADDSPFDYNSDERHKKRKKKKKKQVFPSDDESMKVKPGIKYDKVDMSEKTTDSEENRKHGKKKADDGTEKENEDLSVSTETQYISNN